MMLCRSSRNPADGHQQGIGVALADADIQWTLSVFILPAAPRFIQHKKPHQWGGGAFWFIKWTYFIQITHLTKDANKNSVPRVTAKYGASSSIREWRTRDSLIQGEPVQEKEKEMITIIIQAAPRLNQIKTPAPRAIQRERGNLHNSEGRKKVLSL